MIGATKDAAEEDDDDDDGEEEEDHDEEDGAEKDEDGNGDNHDGEDDNNAASENGHNSHHHVHHGLPNVTGGASASAARGAAGVEAVSISMDTNACELVWQGIIPKRVFSGFKFQVSFSSQ